MSAFLQMYLVVVCNLTLVSLEIHDWIHQGSCGSSISLICFSRIEGLEKALNLLQKGQTWGGVGWGGIEWSGVDEN